MKPKLCFSLLLIFTLALSACSAASASPTVDSANVQNTAAAKASTALAETQAALPTATETALPTVTPTETQAPTETPIMVATETSTETPTLEPTATVATTGNSDCIKPLQGLAGGKPAKIKIENNSGFPITVSLFLNKNSFGDCGYRGYALPKGGSILITDLIQGCYSASAVIDNPKKQAKAFDSGCINNPDKWTFVVLKDSLSLQGR